MNAETARKELAAALDRSPTATQINVTRRLAEALLERTVDSAGVAASGGDGSAAAENTTADSEPTDAPKPKRQSRRKSAA